MRWVLWSQHTHCTVSDCAKRIPKNSTACCWLRLCPTLNKAMTAIIMWPIATNCSDDDGQRWLSSELKSTIGDGIRFAEISEPLNMVKPASGSEQECVTEVIAAGTTVGQSSLAAASDSSTVPQQQPATRIDPQAYDVNPQDDGLASHAARASTVPLDPMQALGHTNSPTPFPYSPVPLPSDSTSQLIQAPLQSPDTKPSSRLQPYHHPAEAVSYSKFQKDRRQTSYGDLRLTAGVTSRRDTSHGDVIVNGHGGQHSRPLTNHSDKQHATVGPGDDTIGLSAVNKEKYVLHPVPVVAKPAFHSFTASIATSAHTLLPSSAPSNNVTAPTVRRTQRLTIESLLSEGVTIAPVSMAVPSAEKKRLSRRHTKKHKRYTHRKKSLSPLLHSWPHSGDESEVTSAYFSSNPVYPQQLSSLSPQRYFRSDAQSTGGQPSQAVSSGLDYLDV